MKNKSFKVVGNFLIAFMIGAMFYWIIYPIVVQWHGVVRGFIIMTTSCFILSLIAFYARIKTKKDWFELSKIKGIEKKIQSMRGSRVKNSISFLTKKSSFVLFWVLSIWFNPVVTTIYISDPTHYGRLRFQEWRIFLFSLAINNIYHVILALGIGEFFIFIGSLF